MKRTVTLAFALALAATLAGCDKPGNNAGSGSSGSSATGSSSSSGSTGSGGMSNPPSQQKKAPGPTGGTK